MATQFFEHQERARRHTTRLIFLFCLAVVALVFGLYLLAAVGTGFRGTDPRTQQLVFEIVWLDPLLMIQVGLLMLLVVGGASLYRVHQLSGGGRVVAEGLGGRLLHSDSKAALERKILNVVEEMAIASGIPTPPVYFLDHEEGVNAFAAGFSPSDAVIGITRGCAEQLSRDELQGVVAHEFSHIMNGDMRLNIRLMGVLYGILVIGMIGYFFLRSSLWAGVASRRSNRGNSTMVMVAGGIALMVLGFVGTFFGNLIKASVSRQREFLADASAVQFTRNPAGIAGALKKIGGFAAGSGIKSPAAPESSHLFFGQALSSGFNSLFATHPPLAERIKILDPSWQGAMTETGTDTDTDAAPSRGSAAVAGFAGDGPAAAFAGSAIEQMGAISTAHLDYAVRLLRELPATVKESAHDPFAARALVYALLMDADPESREGQLEILDAKGERGVPELTRTLLPEVERLGRAHRLPLIDLALPALRDLSASQYERFQGVVHDLVQADQHIDLFEWTLQRILLTHLAPNFEGVHRVGRPLRSKRQLSQVLETILSALARVGNLSESAMRESVASAGQALVKAPLRLRSEAEVGLAALDEALGLAASLDSKSKERVLRACAQVIAADGEVADSEAELFRAIGDSLGCPVPPLLPGQTLV
jgi:Zn-dependent protease with chaperone function/uncharacterized tellurite resistance protein B-like protein